MAIFRERILTRNEFIALFIICTIPIHIWSIVNAFREVPAWIIKMSIWEVLGAFAYTQAFALFETISVVSLLVLIFFLLPRFFVGKQVVPIGMMIVLLVTIWLVILQLNVNWIADRKASALAIWGVSLIVALSVLILLVRRSRRLQVFSQQALDRITVLAVLLLLIDLLSVLVVVVRNIAGAFV